MEKKEAADYLNVSTRTIERFAAAGKLTPGRAKGKTRPIVVFDKGELERLKKELEEARPAEVFRRLNTQKPRDAIGFRLDPFYVKRLEEEGQKSGMSAGEYARQLVIRGLEGPSSEGNIAGLRKNLSDMFYLIMVSRLGATEEEAKDVVRTLAGAG